MVALRKRSRHDRLMRLLAFEIADLEERTRRAKGPKPWLTQQIARLLARIAAEDDKISIPVELQRGLGRLADRPSLKARRRRRAREAAAVRRSVGRYLAGEAVGAGRRE